MKRTMQILLVDDDPGDVMLMQKRFEALETSLQLHVVSDGATAMAYLRCEPPYAASPRPDLILLDWRLPKQHGGDVLQAIKADDALRPIPVVVLTASDDEADVDAAYRLGANSYIAKPGSPEALAEAIACIEDYWLKTVQLPTTSSY